MAARRVPGRRRRGHPPGVDPRPVAGSNAVKPRTRTIIGRGSVALGLAGVVAAVVLLGRQGTPDSSLPSTFLHGVDVSSHDPPVTWSKPAQFGLRFVIARATEGDSRKDTAYESIKREATSAGLAFSAFHFARPQRRSGAAIREADVF